METGAFEASTLFSNSKGNHHLNPINTGPQEDSVVSPWRKTNPNNEKLQREKPPNPGPEPARETGRLVHDAGKERPRGTEAQPED